jgi:DNA polymerase elongation subunit (family B)
MSNKTKVLLANIERIKEIYLQNGNITKTAEKFCEEVRIKYSDSWRRRLSDVFQLIGQENVVVKQETPAKILIFDIETAPIVSYVWGGWQQNPAANTKMIIDEWFVFTWSAKWLFEDEIITGKLTSKEAKKKDDKRIVTDLWKLLEEADIVIAHNALKFDIKKVNTRFLLHGLTPPMPYQVIDTLIHARRTFSFTSNKLDYLAQNLGIEGKLDHEGFTMWDKCYNGDQEALDAMETYNIQDIKVLEEVYLHLRPWIKPHPNIGLFIDSNVSCCSACSSENLQWTGEYKTYANAYPAYRCGDCGSIGRSRTALTNKKNNGQLTLSTPK